MHPGIRDLQKTALLHVNRCVWAQRGMRGQARRPRRKRPWGCDRVVNAGSRLVYCSVQDELSQLLSTEFNIFEHKNYVSRLGTLRSMKSLLSNQKQIGLPTPIIPIFQCRMSTYDTSGKGVPACPLQAEGSRRQARGFAGATVPPKTCCVLLCFLLSCSFPRNFKKAANRMSGHFVRLHQSNSREHFSVFETIDFWHSLHSSISQQPICCPSESERLNSVAFPQAPPGKSWTPCSRTQKSLVGSPAADFWHSQSWINWFHNHHQQQQHRQ